MLQQNGLFCAVKVVALLMLVCLAMPTPVSAQSNDYSRVNIQGPPGVFGDVLLVRDGANIVLYGLTGAVPPQSQVGIHAGVESVTRTASFAGKFPIENNNPIRFSSAIPSVTVTVNYSGGRSATGTINTEIGGPAALQALRDYQEESGLVQSGQKERIEKGVPPHVLLNIVPDNPADEASVGQVLLTQRVIGSGNTAVILDQFEGLSDSGAAVENIRSVPPFSQVEVYSSPVTVDNPDRTKRIQVIDTVNFLNGQFISNGSFIAFAVANNTPVAYLRIISNQENGPNGVPPRVFLASIVNDVSAAISGTPVAVNNNVQNQAGAPGAAGIATITGTADPFSVIIPFKTSAATIPAATDDLLTSPVVADASGNFSVTIPPFAPVGGVYENRQTAFLGVFDPFGNQSSTTVPVTLDTASIIFGTPASSPQPNGQFQITGTAEPNSIIVAYGRFQGGTERFFAGSSVAGANGAFVVDATPYASFEITAIDMAGNSTTANVAGDVTTANPSNLTAVADYPSIIVSGQAEAFASILIYAFPLNQVPTAPTTSATLPPNAFFVTQARADATGAFMVSVPAGISRIIYIQAVDVLGNASQYVGLELVDAQGNPLGNALVSFTITGVTNNAPGLPDVVTGILLNALTGAPIDGSAGNIVIQPFRDIVSDATAPFPFANSLEIDPASVGADGTFSVAVPERDPVLGDFITDFYLVALEIQPDQSVRPIGFDLVDANDNFDRVGPEIAFAPLSGDIYLEQGGRGKSDRLRVNRIYPFGTPSGGLTTLPADALPYIVVLADENDDLTIDITRPDIFNLALGVDILTPLVFGPTSPVPGSRFVDLGENYWDSSTRTVVGHSVVFVALIDAAGNLSPNPIPVELDVTIQDPNPAQIVASGVVINGATNSVEPFSSVTIYENMDRSGFLGSTTADLFGRFSIGGFNLTDDEVFIASKDRAGNESNAVRLEVVNPVQMAQPIVLDVFGLIHTPSTALPSATEPGTMARALAAVQGNPALFYLLHGDGSIHALGVAGQEPSSAQQFEFEDDLARDLEVTSSNPFAGYMLLGNGVVLPFGNAPFYGDLLTLQQGQTAVNRVRLNTTSDLLFDDANNNGKFDTEDTNGNGKLDVIIGIGGQVILNEDVNNNGRLDSESIFDPAVLGQGFGFDIARDLELVRDSSGNVRGYVIMDGFGVMWAFGNDINAQNVRPSVTSGIATSDIFRDLELIVDASGRILDFITLNGFGQVFGLPGGPLGAGAADNPAFAGHLSVVVGAPNFGFDIARDIEPNPLDSNRDGLVDVRDGLYMLDGAGNIYPLAGAPKLAPTDSLVIDLARDLEFGSVQQQ